jgi:hypothetical protein
VVEPPEEQAIEVGTVKFGRHVNFFFFCWQAALVREALRNCLNGYCLKIYKELLKSAKYLPKTR